MSHISIRYPSVRFLLTSTSTQAHHTASVQGQVRLVVSADWPLKATDPHNLTVCKRPHLPITRTSCLPGPLPHCRLRFPWSHATYTQQATAICASHWLLSPTTISHLPSHQHHTQSCLPANCSLRTENTQTWSLTLEPVMICSISHKNAQNINIHIQTIMPALCMRLCTRRDGC